MTIIRIQEQPASENQHNALLSFDHGTQYSIQISDPFDSEQEANLEWYFEEYLNFPFTQSIRAQEAATSIRTYGTELFTQLFSSPEVRDHYRQSIANGLHTLQIEIAGSPAFHRLHWETLYDPELKLPLSQHAPLIRQNIDPQTFPANMQPSQTINVLLVVARPHGTRDVGYRTISRPLFDELQKSKQPISLTLLRPGTYKALNDHLETTTRDYGPGHYHLIHFDVHGDLLTYPSFEKSTTPTNNYVYQTRYARDDIQPYSGEKAFLSLESEDLDRADLVEASEISHLLQRHTVPIVILNACQSGKSIGESEGSLGHHLIQAGVQNVLAMGYSVTVTAAKNLMPILYKQLLAQQNLATALCLGRQTLANQKERRAFYNEKIDLEDWMLPIVYQNRPVHLTVQPLTALQQSALIRKETEYYRPSQQPSYGFVGRDIDILQIEKRLLTKRNILLIRGMGGAGKTTLLHHLASWWQRTGFIKRVFYFGYDDKAWNRQQIMRDIAKQLLGREEFALFQARSGEEQQSQLSQLLKTEQHLLILDNLESVTGSKLAIPHTLSKKEQTLLHAFLKELTGGETLVLLGSRSAEEWLKQGTFEENRHDLAGLDPEAASLLTESILERQQATKYRDDKSLQELIKLLDGFPLALEVVLANLAQQTPTQVLAALQAGDATIKPGTSEERTENILKCIDYSHSNLSLHAQHLLLCLAPFTSVIFRSTLDTYATELKKQPLLAHLAFERWNEVLQEAENWGLLSPDPNIPAFLHIQPVLPYFLRQRFSTQEQHEQRTAIETAFREHYQALSSSIYQFLESKEAEERQRGILFAQYEYENILTALRLALKERTSAINMYNVLNKYLDHSQEHQRGQELDTLILTFFETLSNKEISGEPGKEAIHIFGQIATRHSKMNQYEQATKWYEKARHLLAKISIEEKQRHLLEANLLHNLGIVAEQQRQWPQAEAYYQQTLQIYIDFHDRDGQASTLYQLGSVADKQRQWSQAEAYYQQALQIFIDCHDRHSQALTLHNLGIVAGQRRQWPQAEAYSQQALQIYIDFHDRHSQANIFRNLGVVAQEQRQWPQAEAYYQQALQICIDFHDRHSQANTLHQLGRIAQDQRQWPQAKEYYLSALSIFIDYNDSYGSSIAQGNLARLWKESGDASIPKQLASMLEATPEEGQNLLQKILDNLDKQ